MIIARRMLIIKNALLCTIMFMLSACVSNKPQWPASQASSVLTSLSSTPAQNYTVSVKPAGQSINSFVENDSQDEPLRKVLNAMALETYIEDALVTGLVSAGAPNAIGITNRVQQEETKLNALDKAMRARIKQGTFDKSEFLSLLTSKAKLNSSNQQKGEARLTIAYGLSEDGRLVGVAAKLAYGSQARGTEGFHCEDEFYVSQLSGLPALDSEHESKKLRAAIARSFHLVRDAFHVAVNRMSTLVQQHVSGESVIFSEQNLSDESRLIKTDLITFDNVYLDNVNAVSRPDGSIIGYSVLPSVNNVCMNKIYTISTSEESQLASEVVRKEKRRQLSRKSNEDYLQRFGYQQNLRNQDITFKRLGLKH